MKVSEKRANRNRRRNQHKWFESTRIEQGWFYPQRKVIRLQFPDGVLWEYENCTEETWRELVTASSPGKYVSSHLDHHIHHPV